ncbi:MAG TPA: type IV pilus assembly protein PilM [Chthonomonadales bacterium]|nr:type IV pilus assembly protein PilM [Chthonomonadales bacterium]
MARSGGPTVGLDIGARMIKVAEVVPGRGGVSVRAVGMAPTPPEAMENSVIVDPKLLGDAVKRLLRQAGVSARTSVSSVSGQGALVVRVIEVPRMADGELAEAMKWEVERHVPFAANEVIMDFQRIERPDADPAAQNMEVLLAVAQQDMIDRHVEMLFAAGLKPVAIDVEPLAAARSLIELAPNAYGTKTTVIVNIGASNTDIGIYRDGILAFPRTLPLAGDALNRAIAAQLGISEEDAERQKIEHGDAMASAAPPSVAPTGEGFLDFSAPAPGPRTPFDYADDEGEPMEAPAPVSLTPAAPGDPLTVQLGAAMAGTLGELLTELRRSLEYYRSRSMDGRIDEILLCGGSANLRNLDQLLASDLGIPARVANPFAGVTVASRSLSSDYIGQGAPAFAVAVGLGARDLVRAPVGTSSGTKRGRK